jgi:Type IV secretion-system coupling protein DNA-binding domain
MDPKNPVTYFAETDARNKKIKFGIKAKDRLRHTYVIGKTGMGKSTLLENLAIQDIQNGEGLAVIDPHGSMAEKLLDYVPENRIKDVLYFAPFDMEHPIAFNVMEDVDPDKRHLVVNGLMATFEKIWADAWSARMSYILQYAIIALLEYPNSSLLSINKMLSDKEYRKKVVDNITDASAKSFWVDEFGKYTEKFAAEATPAIQNKVGQFTSNALVRNIIGQPKSSFDVRKMMDEKKILIINLSKGQVGELNARLIGSMLITKIYLAAMSRADLAEPELAKLPNFYLYVDEFQSFANKSFADILSEARKYKLSLTVAHQYVEQMEEEVRNAVFGNVGTMITFRVGAMDAELLEKEFAPVFTAEDLVNLGFAQIYLKLMIDGTSSTPFSAITMAPIPKPEVSFRAQVLEASRNTYGRLRKDVEDDVNRFYEDGRAPQPAPRAPGNDNRGQKYEGGGGNNYDRGGNSQGGKPSFGNSQPRYDGNRPQEQNRNNFSSQQQQQSYQKPQVDFRPPMSPEMELNAGTKEEIRNTEKNTVPVASPISVAPTIQKEDPNKLAFSKIAEELKSRSSNLEARSVNSVKDEGFSSRTSSFKIPDSRNADEKSKVDFRTSSEKNNGPVKMSLNDLKPEHDKAKIPTKENLGSLKDALAGVLKKPEERSTLGSRAELTTVQANDEVRITNQGEIEKKIEIKQEKINEVKNTGPEIKKEEKIESSQTFSRNSNFVTQTSSPKEVPEDVLRKLLQVEEPR